MQTTAKAHIGALSEFVAVAKRRAWFRKYRAINREKISAQRREHYLANRKRLLAQKREYYAANRERVGEKARRNYAANPEKYRERTRRYIAANRKLVNEKHKRYRAANRERFKEYKQRWHVANRERLKEKARRHRAANRERLKEKGRLYYAANREKFRRYAVANRERINKQRRLRYAADPEHFRKQRRRWNADNIEQNRKSQREQLQREQGAYLFLKNQINPSEPMKSRRIRKSPGPDWVRRAKSRARYWANPDVARVTQRVRRSKQRIAYLALRKLVPQDILDPLLADIANSKPKERTDKQT